MISRDETADPEFVSILDYTVDGPEQQRQLVDGITGVIEEWVHFHPGFLSATFHISTDGTRVVYLVKWASEDDYRNFLENSDTDGRIAAITRALGNVDGSVSSSLDGLSHSEIPRYTTYRTITPEHEERDEEDVER